MSMRIQIDIKELVKRIYDMCCDDCKKKLDALTIPVSQTATLKDLFKPSTKG